MKESDIAITAAGNTLYELCSLGIPSIIISHHKRQEKVARIFNIKNAAISLGIGKKLNDKRIRESLKQLINSEEIRRRLSKNSKAMIDGRGVIRVGEYIIKNLKKIE